MSESKNKWLWILGCGGALLLVLCCGAGGALFFLSQQRWEEAREAARKAVEEREMEAQQHAEAIQFDHRLTLLSSKGSAEKLAEAVSILKDRLKRAGIPGRVEVVGETRIRVELQKERVSDAMELLLAGGDLQFKLVSTLEGEERTRNIETITALKQVGEYDPQSERFDVGRMEGSNEPVLLENPGVDGYLIAEVYPAKDDRGLGAIGFRFGEQGRERFRKLTAENIKRNLAIVLDGVVKSAPVIQSAIDGQGIITQNEGFKPQEVERLVTILRSGKLPIELTLEEE